ncbi:unnamed protein product, partial [Brenthis ino]
MRSIQSVSESYHTLAPGVKFLRCTGCFEWVVLFVVTGEAWVPRVPSWSGNDLDTKRVALGSTWRLTPAVCCRNAAAAAFPKGV